MQPGDKVIIKPPFGLTFTGQYTIIDVVDGVYFLNGIEGGFDPMYLEAV